jgi:RNA polymerase sigma factor (sigma-70 family)
MEAAAEPLVPPSTDAQDQRIRETVRTERSRLLAFIRRRIPEPDEAEDVLQDIWYEFIEATRLTKPIEQLAGWLFSVARHKIADWHRRRKPDSLDAALASGTDDDEPRLLADLLPTDGTSPEDELLCETILDALTEALGELPAVQRAAFVAHELDGQSFREMAEETGISINTLLARKRYAVLYLRERLRALYDEVVTT